MNRDIEENKMVELDCSYLLNNNNLFQISEHKSFRCLSVYRFFSYSL